MDVSRRISMFLFLFSSGISFCIGKYNDYVKRDRTVLLGSQENVDSSYFAHSTLVSPLYAINEDQPLLYMEKYFASADEFTSDDSVLQMPSRFTALVVHDLPSKITGRSINTPQPILWDTLGIQYSATSAKVIEGSRPIPRPYLINQNLNFIDTKGSIASITKANRIRPSIMNRSDFSYHLLESSNMSKTEKMFNVNEASIESIHMSFVTWHSQLVYESLTKSGFQTFDRLDDEFERFKYETYSSHILLSSFTDIPNFSSSLESHSINIDFQTQEAVEESNPAFIHATRLKSYNPTISKYIMSINDEVSNKTTNESLGIFYSERTILDYITILTKKIASAFSSPFMHGDYSGGADGSRYTRKHLGKPKLKNSLPFADSSQIAVDKITALKNMRKTQSNDAAKTDKGKVRSKNISNEVVEFTFSQLYPSFKLEDVHSSSTFDDKSMTYRSVYLKSLNYEDYKLATQKMPVNLSGTAIENISSDISHLLGTPMENFTRHIIWLFIIGAIIVQIQLILGLFIIWCCLRARVRNFLNYESVVFYDDGLSRVVNFRNSTKLLEEMEEKAETDGNKKEKSKSNSQIPKCLTTPL